MKKNLRNAALLAAAGFSLFLTDLHAQSLPPFNSVTTASSSGSDGGVEIITDNQGNVYTSGFMGGDIQLGAINLPTAGTTYGSYIAKQDASGNYLWARAFPKTSNTQVATWQISIALDATNNFYSAGRFVNSLTFGSTTLTAPGGGGDYSIFITKQAPDQSYTWTAMIGDPGASGIIYSVNGLNVDADDNLYMTGTFTGTIDFDPGTGTADLSSPTATSTFILKFDNLGALLWAKALTPTAGNTGNRTDAQGIAVDANGNVYTSGTFRVVNLVAGQSVDFDPGAGALALRPAGPNDIGFFINKLDANGDHVWTRTYGNTNSIQDRSTTIKVDGNGDVYATGYFTGTAIDFDPGAGSSLLTEVGNADAFMLKLTAAGDFAWVNQIGSSNVDYIRDFEFDSDNNIYLTGPLRATVDFDSDPVTTHALTPPAIPVPYIAKWDKDGRYIDVQMLSNGTLGNGEARAIAVNGAGTQVLVYGSFGGTLDFDPGTGTHNEGAASNDIFVLNLSPTTVPITLSRFNASAKDNAAELNWTTASESGNKGFEILRSPDGLAWQQIGYVTSQATEGNSVHDLAYEYTDNTPLPGVNYYRLKQVDINGRTSLSVVRPVSFKSSTEISLFPNPTPANVYLRGIKGGETITVYNATGQVQATYQANKEDIYQVSLAGLTKGIYFIKVSSKEKVSQTFRVALK